MSTEPSGTDSQLGKAALHGVRWTAIGRAVAEVSALLFSVVLARLIAPGEFGAAVIALLVVTLATVLREQGFTTPLVQRKLLRREHEEVVMLASVVAGVVAAALTVALVPVLWTPVFDAQTGNLVALAAASFVIAPLAAIPHARLQRRLDFRNLNLVELGVFVLGQVVTVGLAVTGMNAEALVIGGLVSTAAGSLLLLVIAGAARPRWDWPHLRDLLAIGLPSTVSAVGYTLYRSGDYLLIGAIRGTAQLGIYWRAYQLAVEYQSKITGIMLRVALPVYARAEDREQMLRLRTRIVRGHALVLFPLLVLLVVSAPVLIPFLYGPAWTGAVLLTQILGMAGLGMVVGTGLGPLMTALGHARELMLLNLASLSVLVGVVLVTAPMGLTQAAIGVSVTQTATAIAGNYLLGSRLAGIPLRHVAADIVPALAGSALLALSSLAVLETFDRAGAPPPVTLLFTGAVGGVTYVGALRFVFPQAWRDLELIVSSILRRRGLSPAATEPSHQPA